MRTTEIKEWDMHETGHPMFDEENFHLAKYQLFLLVSTSFSQISMKHQIKIENHLKIM